MTGTNEINQVVKERDLNQWHLLVASLLGSLGQKGSTQGALNLLMTRSMDDFLIPFFEGHTNAEEIRQKIATERTLQGQMAIVVKHLNEVFSLAGEMAVESGENPQEAVVRVKSNTCRFCPIGVGKAKLDPNATYCPIPTMIEKSANYFRAGLPPLKLRLFREKANTRVLQKKDGNCYISYVVEG